MAMSVIANQDTIGCTPDLNPEKEERALKRETSVDDAATAVPTEHPTQDSLSSVSDASDHEDSEARESSDTDNESTAVDQSDVQLAAISGIWWGSSGERYNVEKTASGLWRCVRRGTKLGQQKAYSLHCESDGRVIWSSCFVLDTVVAEEGCATWRSLKTAPGGKAKKLTWSRTRLAVAGDAPEAAAASEPSTSEPVEPEPQAEAMSYSRSLMLQIRLKLAEADEAEPVFIGAKCRPFRPPPGLEVQEPSEEAAADASASPMTTVMLRNLPNQCTRSSLEKFVCRMGFDGAFDLVYMPVDRTNGNNLGYAFINFTEASSCQVFISKMHNTKASKCFPGSRSAKVLQCCYAKVQGREPYLQGLANANKLAGAESAWDSTQASCWGDAAAEPSSASSSGCSAVVGAPWRRRAVAEAVQSQESPTPAASSRGLRADAPDFVPGAMGEITNTDEFLEALTGRPVSELLAQSHREAAVRARHCAAQHHASQLFVPPAARAAAVPAERSVEASRIFIPVAA